MLKVVVGFMIPIDKAIADANKEYQDIKTEELIDKPTKGKRCY